MKALLLVTTWVFVFIPMISAMISFDLEEATEQSYSTFLTSLRTEAKDPKLVHFSIPMLPAPVTPQTYFLVKLIATQHISITLALARNDLYVWAYLDQFEREPRAHFFLDAPSNAMTTLFKEAKIHTKTMYRCSYSSIEKMAISGRSRMEFGLGIAKLKYCMENVYGKKINTNFIKHEARFMLVVIQMVSEATRFKYIENQVLENFPNEFNPDYKVIDLEKHWSKISKTFVESDDESIVPPLRLDDAHNKLWVVTKITEIKPDMGILQYNTGTKTNIFSRVLKAIINDDVEHVDL